ncbi:Uncharacterised protein [Mycobacterium tuberculosis]|nr:Uncharacterised protein [Mycobacterium tuberculosis]
MTYTTRHGARRKAIPTNTTADTTAVSELARTRRPALRCMPQCMTASAACSKRWRPVPICVDTSRWL